MELSHYQNEGRSLIDNIFEELENNYKKVPKIKTMEELFFEIVSDSEL